MSRKGNSRHINRFAASKYLKINRKVSQYVAKPDAGRYTLGNSMALITLLKEKLGVSTNSKEARYLIKGGNISVNGKTVRIERYPVGFGDIITIVPINKSYRIGVAKKGVISTEEHAKEKGRTMKVIGKYVGSKNTTMLRLYDGTVVKGKEGVKVNDSVVLDGNAIKSIIKMQKGAKCYVIKGTHASESGIILDIISGTATRAPIVQVEGASKFQTLLDNVMVTGE
jgi:ribosomal protein S4E